MTYTQPLVVAADVGPLHTPHLLVRRCNGLDTQQRVTRQSESAAGFRPTVEQLTRGHIYLYHRWGELGVDQCTHLVIHKRDRALNTDTAEHLGVHMMYTITRGPSKLVTQRRTGPTQQIESKFSDLKLKPTSWLLSNAPPPKIVFNRLNGKRYHGAATQKSASPAEGSTPEHEENVRFVFEAWQEVEQKLGDGESAESQGPVQYTEKTPSAAMKSKHLHLLLADFVPIDLEEWWAQRFLANIANLS